MLGLSHVAFLTLSSLAIIVIALGRRHVGLDPLEAERIFELPLREQGPGSVRMFLDDAMQQPVGITGGRSRFFTVLDGRVGHESPGIGLGILELRRVFLYNDQKCG